MKDRRRPEPRVSVVYVRLTGTEHRAVRRAAARLRLPVGVYARGTLLEAAKKVVP